jgi:DNA-binding transcriptional regulator YiaG
MKTKTEQFEVLVPNSDGNGVAERVTVSIPMIWDDELGEWLLTAEAHQIIEKTKARRMGLIQPEELHELRARLGLTQEAMSNLLQIGAKSYTRWETGRERPSRSINVLLCALRDQAVSIEYLKNLSAAGKQKNPATKWLFVGHFYGGSQIGEIGITPAKNTTQEVYKPTGRNPMEDVAQEQGQAVWSVSEVQTSDCGLSPPNLEQAACSFSAPCRVLRTLKKRMPTNPQNN